MSYFSYDPNDGFEIHETEAQAKARAEQSLEYHEAEAAGDGWPENTHEICWGKISQQVECIEEIKRPDDSELDEDGNDASGLWWNSDWDSIQRFEFKPSN